MCAINVLCFLDYLFYKLVEYGFRKGQGGRAYDIWSNLGEPHKVYLGSIKKPPDMRTVEFNPSL